LSQFWNYFLKILSRPFKKLTARAEPFDPTFRHVGHYLISQGLGFGDVAILALVIFCPLSAVS
jgi:hypothetical protein